MKMGHSMPLSPHHVTLSRYKCLTSSINPRPWSLTHLQTTIIWNWHTSCTSSVHPMTRYLTGLTESHSSSWLSSVERSTFPLPLLSVRWTAPPAQLSFYLSLSALSASPCCWMAPLMALQLQAVGGFSFKHMFCCSGINADDQHDVHT